MGVDDYLEEIARRGQPRAREFKRNHDTQPPTPPGRGASADPVYFARPARKRSRGIITASAVALVLGVAWLIATAIGVADVPVEIVVLGVGAVALGGLGLAVQLNRAD
jgi:hypothetical protein